MAYDATIGLATAGATEFMASNIVCAIDLAEAANDVDPSNAVDNCPTSTCSELVEPAMDGGNKAVPHDEVDERPDCPSTGPESPTAMVAAEPNVPAPEFPTSCPDCGDEEAEDVVSAKRSVTWLPNGLAAN